jgi:carbon storage regulator
MLVLSRRVGEKVLIGNGTWIKVLEIKGDRVRLGFEADPEISIRREEVLLEAAAPIGELTEI